MPASRPRVTVVGLGPAGADYLNPATVELLASAPTAFLRTSRHPAADALGLLPTFDHLYGTADTFEEVYGLIVEALVEAAVAVAPEPVVYAVPGSPLVAERTVELLRADPRLDLTVIPALSFLDLAWERLGLDPMEAGVRLRDATALAAEPPSDGAPLLVGQCWSQTALSDIKLAFEPEDDRPMPAVTLLHHLGLPDERVEQVEWWDLDRTFEPDHLTSLFIAAMAAPSSAAQAMARLETLVTTLRRECPWDQVQTHESLMPHLIEECYEVLDALTAVSSASDRDPTDAAYAHLEEELGDLLFQIAFHACLAAEDGRFSLRDVATGIHDKLVHRHPHVFGDVEATTPDQVVGNWEAIKKVEKGRTSVTEGIPSQLPALMLTAKLQRKAHSVGLASTNDFDDVHRAIEALSALAAARATDDADAPLSTDDSQDRDVLGSLLFAVVDLSRRAGLDAEHALRARANAFRQQIVDVEADVTRADD